MKKILFILLLLPSLVFAEKQLSKKDMSMLGKIDETTMNAEAKKAGPTFNPEKDEKKVTMTCTEKDGRVFKADEVGYDTCLNNLKNSSMFNKRNSGVGSSKDTKDQNASGMTFKIGE